MLGSLYFDGQPQEIGAKYNGERITLGPTIADMEIRWNKANGLLIANRCVCSDISWEQLHVQELVFGTPAQIDGQLYLCRCLDVGSKASVPNEWDAALDATNESDELWHWKKEFFWGQNPVDSALRAYRGYSSARNWSYDSVSRRNDYLGFRPALEPLGPEPCSPDALIGKEARIYGPGWETVSGILTAYSDYDLMLKNPTPLPDACTWAVPAGKQVIVDRASVSWLRKS